MMGLGKNTCAVCNRLVGLVGLVLLVFTGTVSATAQSSSITIDYSDWTAVLKESVLPTGRSDRRPSFSVNSQSGTRIKTVSNGSRLTRLEANRVFFHALEKKHMVYLRKLRASLERLPSEIPLTDLSDNEQLAYWLNLHNVTVYLMVAEIYPVTRLKNFVREGWPKKRLTIEGKAWSLADIERYVVARWKDPRVIYGFYNGAIGGPNLRREAYSGDTVWASLEKNGMEFVNSLRGLNFRGNTAKASTLFSLLRPIFTDFDTELVRHLEPYADPQVLKRLEQVRRITTDVTDWAIADIYNGRMARGTPSAGNSAAFVIGLGEDAQQLGGKVRSLSRFPPHVQKLLLDINTRNLKRKRKGKVTVEEIIRDTEK